jgi:hypothetical protein
MRATGISMRYLDQRDQTPMDVDPGDMAADLIMDHRTMTRVEEHTRTFLTPAEDSQGRPLTQTIVTVRWTVNNAKRVVRLFEDTRGERLPEPALAH